MGKLGGLGEAEGPWGMAGEAVCLGLPSRWNAEQRWAGSRVKTWRVKRQPSGAWEMGRAGVLGLDMRQSPATKPDSGLI